MLAVVPFLLVYFTDIHSFYSFHSFQLIQQLLAPTTLSTSIHCSNNKSTLFSIAPYRIRDYKHRRLSSLKHFSSIDNVNDKRLRADEYVVDYFGYNNLTIDYVPDDAERQKNRDRPVKMVDVSDCCMDDVDIHVDSHLNDDNDLNQFKKFSSDLHHSKMYATQTPNEHYQRRRREQQKSQKQYNSDFENLANIVKTSNDTIIPHINHRIRNIMDKIEYKILKLKSKRNFQEHFIQYDFESVERRCAMF